VEDAPLLRTESNRIVTYINWIQLGGWEQLSDIYSTSHTSPLSRASVGQGKKENVTQF
jgi:hypothetical protein